VPYPGGNWTNKLLCHRLEQPAPLTSLRLDVPPYIVRAVERLMARQPEDRYPDAEALLADLEPPFAVAAALPVRPSPPPRRRSLFWRAVGAALLGACAGGAARMAMPAPVLISRPVEEQTAIVLEQTSITVNGRKEEFPDLQRAIDSASDGGTITLRGSTPLRTPPVFCHGKSLTIRSAKGTRVRIERGDSTPSPWDALIWGDRAIHLIDLDLSGGDSTAPVIAVEGGRLTVTGCSLKGAGEGPLVALRMGRSLAIERTRFESRAQGIAVEVGTEPIELWCRESSIKVRNPIGAAIVLWSSEPTDASLTMRLNDTEIDSGRVVALRALGGRVSVESVSCRLAFTEALVSLDACRDRSDWRSHLSWSGRDNRHTSRGSFLRLDGRSLAWDEKALGRLNER
jgi:hypothetical protein